MTEMENYRKVLRCKIHRATVTHADLEYEGSITIPPELMQLAGLAEYEAVHVWNVTAGSRFETYAILGMPQSTDVCVNGAAARLVQPGDKVIVAAFQLIPESTLASYEPRLIFVDENNRFKEARSEVAGPQRLACV